MADVKALRDSKLSFGLVKTFYGLFWCPKIRELDPGKRKRDSSIPDYWIDERYWGLDFCRV